MKKCNKCGKVKKRAEFYNRQNLCDTCYNKRGESYYIRNKERIKKRNLAYYYEKNSRKQPKMKKTEIK